MRTLRGAPTACAPVVVGPGCPPPSQRSPHHLSSSTTPARSSQYVAGQGPGSGCDRLTNHLAQKIAFLSTRQLASLSAPWAGKEPPAHLDLGLAGGCSGPGPRSFLAYVLCVSPLPIPALSLPPFSFLSLTPSITISPHSTPQSIAPICIRTDFSV